MNYTEKHHKNFKNIQTNKFNNMQAYKVFI